MRLRSNRNGSQATTYGSEEKIVCPACWGAIFDLWEVTGHLPFELRCEHCDAALVLSLSTKKGDTQYDWQVNVK